MRVGGCPHRLAAVRGNGGGRATVAVAAVAITLYAALPVSAVATTAQSGTVKSGTTASGAAAGGTTSSAWARNATASGGATPRAAAAPVGCAGAEPPGVYQGAEPWAQRYLDARASWTITRGGGVTVAVLSSGVDAANDQLAGSVATGYDALTGQPGADTDCDGRGTRTAGVVAAQQVSGTTVHGVAPEVRILPVRVVQRVARADGSEATDVGGGPGELAAGIAWATAQGAQVICVTVTTDRDDPRLRSAVAAARAAGSLVVSGGAVPDDAGGETSDGAPPPRYPSAYADVLAVGALAVDGTLVAGSERGPYLDVTAPAAAAVSTASTGGAGGMGHSQPQDDPALATAAVAGTAALVRDRHRDRSPADVAARITDTGLAAPRAASGSAAGSGGTATDAAPSPGGALPAPPVVRPSAAVTGHVVGVSEPVGVARVQPVPDESGLDPAERRALVVAAILTTLGVLGATVAVVLRSRNIIHPLTSRHRGRNGQVGPADE
ncbi:MAG: S8 family serine peptidase [Dermatophilaceae bacterium]